MASVCYGLQLFNKLPLFFYIFALLQSLGQKDLCKGKLGKYINSGFYFSKIFLDTAIGVPSARASSVKLSSCGVFIQIITPPSLTVAADDRGLGSPPQSSVN